MRYYGFEIGTSAKEIQENSKVKWKDYDYDSPIAAVNKYMYQKIKNGLTFLTYGSSDNNTLYSMFSYDESKYSLQGAYSYILDMLEEAFGIKKVVAAPYEITSYQCYEFILESRRRNFFHHHRLVDLANLRIHEDFDRCVDKQLYFKITEKIISGTASTPNLMYDQSLIKELSNIREHQNLAGHKGNMVHYVISDRSVEAASDMTEALMNCLYEAKRISTKRMVIISDIAPDLYKSSTYLEEVIENNRGGVVIMDLSEKFSCDPVSYGMTCKYLEKVVKRYKNECLFVFTYNMDAPGFSYSILANLKKYVIPVMLKEGSGNKEAAVKYMEMLIKASEYSDYAKQAEEFMERFPGDEFSQTDVLMAYEQFEPWCINKNILQAYDFDLSDDFMLDRSLEVQSPGEKLNALIGLKAVKEQIEGIIAARILEKRRKECNKEKSKSGTMHMIFAGNPGSAKTTVAKLFAEISREKGILKSGAFVERSGTDFNGMDCVYRIRKAFEAAKDGVLFVDEAYSLFGETAITTLIQEMENNREEVIVVLAGYNERMKDFLELNEGLKSRIPYWIDFPDYDADELTEIFKLMLKERGFTATENAIKEAYYLFDKARYVDDFGNGRYVRNLLEDAIKNQSVRLLAAKGNVETIPEKDLFLINKDDICMTEEGCEDRKEAGASLKELEAMIGLSSAKSVIKKAIASFKMQKFCMEKGIHKDKASMHMVFTGNPGTAKTTVARLFAEIMKDEKVLPTGKFLEVGRADLIGTHVGQTAPKVKKKFKEARGGVLFIDEAYSLCDGCEGSFGDEAINTIVQEMENHREDTIVIFAGYPNEMQKFLDRNPGLSSRVAFRVKFEDYSLDELCDITRLMMAKKDMKIADAAMDKLAEIYEHAAKSSDYGNGRFVRKMLEEAEMNLAERVFETGEFEMTKELISTIEECDVPDFSEYSKSGKRTIGFKAS